jgi:hypothetical protein
VPVEPVFFLGLECLAAGMPRDLAQLEMRGEVDQRPALLQLAGVELRHRLGRDPRRADELLSLAVLDDRLHHVPQAFGIGFLCHHSSPIRLSQAAKVLVLIHEAASPTMCATMTDPP